jgi:MFS family permease
MVDKVGKRVYFMLTASCLMFCAHFIYVFLPDCDECIEGIPILILLGVGYALYASVMWASIPLVVDAKTVGTAFGLTTAVQNFGLFLAPLLVGVITVQTSEYKHGY